MQRGNKKNRILDYWIGIPGLNTLATLRHLMPQRHLPEHPRRIGVLCSPALGDTLLFSSVLQDVRAHYPAAEIVHLCMKQNLAAAELIPGADRRVVISLTQPAQTIRQIRAQHLDVLFDFSSWQRLTALYSLLSGARFTAGFRTAGQYRGRGYDLAVEHRGTLHEVDNFRSILTTLAIPASAPPRVIVPEATGQEPLAEVHDIVVFHPWASGQRSWLREWPEERWFALAGRIASPATIFAITGAPSDLPRTEPFVQRMQQSGLHAVAFAGTDGFRSVSRLLLRARVVVSVNTGVMHLAAIAGAPTVSINGPNRNGRWGPVGPRARGIEAPGEGCGYLHLGFNFDGQAKDCMERISVDMVVQAVVEVEAL